MDWGRLLAGLGSVATGVKTLRGALGRGETRPMRQTMVRVRNIDQRVKYIIVQIRKGRRDPRLRQAVSNILSRKCGDKWCIPEKNWRGEVVALFNAVRKTVRYTLDPIDRDLFQSPQRTVQMGIGDCDDVTSLLAALLQSAGYPVKLRVVQTQGNQTWNHIYLVVGLPPTRPSQWLPLDASVNKPAGWEVSKRQIIRKRDFEVR